MKLSTSGIFYKYDSNQASLSEIRPTSNGISDYKIRCSVCTYLESSPVICVLDESLYEVLSLACQTTDDLEHNLGKEAVLTNFMKIDERLFEPRPQQSTSLGCFALVQYPEERCVLIRALTG